MPEPKPFIVGRESELAEFVSLIEGRTRHWLLNFFGPGGIGKSVLCGKFVDYARAHAIPFAVVDGIRPDLTPDRILYATMEGIIESSKEEFSDDFRDFTQQYEDYLAIQTVLQRGGGVQSLFDVVGNVKDPAGLAQIIGGLGKTITENVQRTINNRFTLERYLRGVDKLLTASLTGALKSVVEKQKKTIVLLIDTYEEIEGLDDWMCRALIPALPSGVKVVIFGRNALVKVSFDWNEFGDSLRSIDLSELSEADANAYLVHHGLRDVAVLEKVYRFTGGYPLLLVLVVHLSREAGGWDKIGALESEVDRDRVASKQLERILREERVEEVRAFLEKGVIARWFNPEIISVILETNLDQARAIYGKLQRYSFVESHPYGLKFHDKIRELLVERLKFTSQAEYQRLTKRLMDFYAEKAGIQKTEEPKPTSLSSTTYNIYIQDSKGIAIGDTAGALQALDLAEMVASDNVNAVTFVQGLASLLRLSHLIHGDPYRPDVYAALFDGTSVFGDITTLARLPFLFVRDLEFLQMTADELRRYLSKIVEPDHRVFVFVSWSMPSIRELADNNQTALTKLQQVWAYDCVLFGREELANIIFSPDPQATFRKIVIDQVNLVNISPFVTRGTVTQGKMFFGREKELREIIERAAIASYALVGGRQIGKTSILYRLERVRLRAAGFRALFHDCGFTPTQAELVQALVADKAWFPEPPTSTPDSFAMVIRSLPEDRPLVILLDEADKLVEPDRRANYPLFNTLRAMANAGRCRFVLSGERALRAELRNPNSPLYNFTNEMLIGSLDFHAVGELVTHPMKQLEIELEDEGGIVRRIWNFTSGHPNIVQRLCQRLIVRLNERRDRHLTLVDVDAVVADPDFLRKDFLNVYWERASALERLGSLVMAADENARTLAAVHETLNKRGIQVTLNQVDGALERLVDLRNILQRTATGYEFAVTAFPEVIAKTARLDDLIALNRETFQRDGDVEPHSERGRQ